MGSRGRPRLVDPARVLELRRAPERYTWAQIAEKLGVSVDTVVRAYRIITAAPSADRGGDISTDGPNGSNGTCRNLETEALAQSDFVPPDPAV